MKLTDGKRILCFGFVFIALLNGQAATNDLTLFSLKKTAPVLDGVLNDACWQGAQTANGFMTLGKMEKARADTAVMSCYDEANLYLAVRLDEPYRAKLRISHQDVYSGDCVEIFLDPENKGQSYFHIAVDSQGNRSNTFNDGGAERQIALDISAKTGCSNGYWTIEMAIPFAALNASLPTDNRRWGFNVGRERYAVTPQENSAWAALGVFNERERFGKLAFYSRHEVVADADYWAKSDRDPLMMRPVVSGYDIALKGGPAKRAPTLWTYDPFGANRTNQAWKALYLTGKSREVAEAKYPEFHRAAEGVNRLLVAKANADDGLAQLRRQLYYAGTNGTTAATVITTDLEKESAAIDEEMNSVYMAYGAAWDAGWNTNLLAKLDGRIAALSLRIAGLQQSAGEATASIRQELHKVFPWESVSLAIPPEDRMLNADGATRRFTFSGWHATPIREEPVSLLTKFDSTALHWPAAIPKQPSPGVCVYEYLDNTLQNTNALGDLKAILQVTFGLHTYWMPLLPSLATKLNTDADILLRSQDGLTVAIPKKTENVSYLDGINPNNPEVKAYTQDYLKNLAAHLAPGGKMDFFLTAWESSLFFHPVGTNGALAIRSVGYNESGKKAFRAYLEERYSKIETLNRKWHTTYPAFDAVEPPDDKYIKPPSKASGLTFEFERWQRVNWARYIAGLRTSLKAGAPSIPVMVDPSATLTEMSGYLLFKEHAADIYSYHYNPLSEEALWTYFSTMQRKFGGELGYLENYFQMYASSHLKDERLAQRDISKFFFDLLMYDIRYSTWWLTFYLSHKTDYIVAYGGGTFGLDYDQTILRWSIAGLAPMFARCRNIERALLESAREVPKTAIIQPCATVFNLASMGRIWYKSPAIQEMLAAHYRILQPGNYPHDYLPEDMVLDKNASLKDYTVLVLPYAPYMTEQFSKQLMAWTRNGGTLIAIGPFGLHDECGFDLPAESSLFRTLFPEIARVGAGDWDYGSDGKSAAPTTAAIKYGKGTLAYLNRNADVIMRTSAMKEPLDTLLNEMAQRTAVAPDPDLKIAMRQGAGRSQYLCVCNRNVEKPVETTVTVKGSYRQALDIMAPGWDPVPAETKDGQTTVKIRLDPGDFTMIMLKP